MSDGRYEMGEFVRITPDGLTPTRVDFLTAWETVAEEGLADCVGGAQYERLRDEWLASGRPTPIAPWIRARANSLPAP